jgi:putative addiction module component (TIGR02574 family)
MALRVGLELVRKALIGWVFFRHFDKLPLNLPLKLCAAMRCGDTARVGLSGRRRGPRDRRRKFWDNPRAMRATSILGVQAGTMDIDALEREALKLPAEDRARLARDLLDSLDELSGEELDRLWLQEANQRAAQIDAGEVKLLSAEEVDRKARALLR